MEGSCIEFHGNMQGVNSAVTCVEAKLTSAFSDYESPSNNAWLVEEDGENTFSLGSV